jgi:small subunit ribosomal protein S13
LGFAFWGNLFSLETQKTETQNFKEMARIAGIDLPRNKRGVVGLTYIYGIGRSRAKEILDLAGIDENLKVANWSDDNVRSITQIIQRDYKVEGELRSEVQMSIKRLMDIACYRGLRHRKGLPVRGQRTKTNARTRKGRRKTVANKKLATKK